jgi:hypothetical protein
MGKQSQRGERKDQPTTPKPNAHNCTQKSRESKELVCG